MTCREMLDFLAEYEGNTLPPEVRRQFDAHIARCPPCIAYMESYFAAIALGKKCMCDDTKEVSGEVPEMLIQAILKARQQGDAQKKD